LNKFQERLLEDFMRDARRYRILTKDEEAELIRRKQNGDKRAFDKLVLHNMRLVISEAMKSMRFGGDVLDLIQEGILGLIDSVERAEVREGARFAAYAKYRIKQNIHRHSVKRGAVAHFSDRWSAYFITAIKRYPHLDTHEAMQRYIAEKYDGDPPEDYIDMTTAVYHALRGGRLALDSPVDPDSHKSAKFEEVLADEDSNEPFRQVEIHHDLWALIRNSKNLLKPRAWHALRRTYLDGWKLEDTAAEMGLSRERVRQLTNEAIRAIRRCNGIPDDGTTILVAHYR